MPCFEAGVMNGVGVGGGRRSSWLVGVDVSVQKHTRGAGSKGQGGGWKGCVSGSENAFKGGMQLASRWFQIF